MSDDEADPELVALLRERLGLNGPPANAPPELNVLKHAQYIVDNAVDVALDMQGTKYAAKLVGDGLAARMEKQRAKLFDTASIGQAPVIDDNVEVDWAHGGWHAHPLHPPADWQPDETLRFIFTVDLLNFSFWSELPEDTRFAVEYRGQKWTGYSSLLAVLRRALDEGYPITHPELWHAHEDCPDYLWEHFFRSATKEEMPLLTKRIAILRDAAAVIHDDFDMIVVNMVQRANNSAAGLVNLLVDKFPCFRDEGRFEKKPVQFLKRAQIFVGDLWAAFGGQGYGRFDDIDKLTMFADYRVPQLLHSTGALYYAPPLVNALQQKKELPSGHSWEMQIRGCSIWCVELIKRQVMRAHPDLAVNAVLIDFYLYDLSKELEAQGQEQLPHHRTRSIWY